MDVEDNDSHQHLPKEVVEIVLNNTTTNKTQTATKPTVCTILYNKKLDKQIKDKEEE